MNTNTPGGPSGLDAGAPEFEYVKWSPKFELGIPVIDAQHKTLVNLCNSFYQTLIQRKSDWKMPWEESLAGTLRKCVEYAMTHLKDEEKLMSACGYPGYAQHKQAHALFIKEILSTTEGFKDATIGTAFKFVKFLYDWILSHIAHDDKLYVPYVLDYYRKQHEGR
ncbi:MAG: bacteriohemerythrin [Treponemataceae bacterium]|nr:bacteriohemerythrin [Treponemataceae bacterium]